MSTSQTSTATYITANSIPQTIIDALNTHRSANVILPMILKSKLAEMMGEVIEPAQQWVVHTTGSSIDLILSCTNNGTLGTYPAFIVALVPSEQLSREFLLPRIQSMIEALCEAVSTRRAYSVFAPHLITNVFVELWSRHTGIQAISEPYYDSWMSYCTRDTFNTSRKLREPGPGSVFDLRPANDSDIEQVAELCFGFAAECPPFTLTQERAREEAASLIRKNQLWVHRIIEGGASNIASICALTRNTSKVATITKVYTNPQFRKRGCAERLVRRVCQNYFTTKNVESIVLYVGVDNPAANVYSKVGFVGLTEESRQGAERWTEIGFDQSKVDLGHW